MSFSKAAGCFVSGSATKITSACFTASPVSKTSKPFSFATARDFDAGIEADDDLDAAFLEVQRVGVALGAEAEHGAGFAFENGEVGVFVGVDFCGHGERCGLRLKIQCDLRARATRPVRVSSVMPNLPMSMRNLSIFDSLPVTSMASTFVLHVDDLRAEDVADLHDLGAVRGVHVHAHEHELALDHFVVAEVLDLDDVDRAC